MDLSGGVWTDHAREQASQRSIAEADVASVLRNPARVESVRAGRVVAQGPIEAGGHHYLLRVFVDVDRTPPEIVTAYRTSRISKYARQP